MVVLLGSTVKRLLLGVGFEVSNAKARPRVSLFLLPAHLDVERSATYPASCLACMSPWFSP